MNPASSEPAEFLHRLRQQLILAQARIMELEDARDELAPKLIEAEKMQRAAQQLADQKVDLARNVDNLVADFTARLSTAEQRAAQLQRELSEATKLLQQQKAAFAALEKNIADTTAANSVANARIAELDAELRAMKASRRWRWTTWLR